MAIAEARRRSASSCAQRSVTVMSRIGGLVANHQVVDEGWAGLQRCPDGLAVMMEAVDSDFLA